jgi:hypothetical protein
VWWRAIGRPDRREAQRDAENDEDDAADIGMRDDPANAGNGTQDEERGKARQESALHGVPPIVCLEAESVEVWVAKKQEASIWARKDPERVKSDMTSARAARISPASCPGYATHVYRRYKRNQFDIVWINDQTGQLCWRSVFCRGIAGVLRFAYARAVPFLTMTHAGDGITAFLIMPSSHGALG